MSDPKQKKAAGNLLKFLAIMLVFTLVARGTSAATLARVDVALPARGDIVETISGMATVSANNHAEIMAPEGLTLAELYLTPGQDVTYGDLIAQFMIDEIEEAHTRQTATLHRMELDLARLQENQPLDHTPIDNARRNLNRAREDYQQLLIDTARDIENAQQAVADLENTDLPPGVVRNHQRALEDYLDTVARGAADIQTAQENLNSVGDNLSPTELENATRNHQRALEDYQHTQAQVAENIRQAEENLASATTANNIDNAQRQLTRAQEDLATTTTRQNRLVADAEEAFTTAQNTLDMLPYPPEDPAFIAAQGEVTRLETQLENARTTRTDAIRTATHRVEDATATLSQAQAGESTTLETQLDNAIRQGEDAIQTATRRLEDAENTLAQATLNRDRQLADEEERATTALENTIARVEAETQTAARRLEDATDNEHNELLRAHTNLESTIQRGQENQHNARRRIEDAEATLAQAEDTHRRNASQQADTAQQNAINIPTMAWDIQHQEQAVNQLADLLASEGRLYAAYSGAVATTMVEGATTNANTPIATIRNGVGGFIASLTIPASQADQLTVGSQVDVTMTGGSLFFTPTDTGHVSSIGRPDSDNQVDITIQLPGTNWSEGQRTEVEVVLSQGSHDMVLPASALRSDNLGHFVYVVNHQSTVLGVANVAHRVNVNLVARDRDTVSITGGIGTTTPVISATNRLVTEGSRVRLNQE